MAGEIRLEPGWFAKDVRRASERLSEWTQGDARIAMSWARPGTPPLVGASGSNRVLDKPDQLGKEPKVRA
jgi:hypothetical protein